MPLGPPLLLADHITKQDITQSLHFSTTKFIVLWRDGFGSALVNSTRKLPRRRQCRQVIEPMCNPAPDTPTCSPRSHQLSSGIVTPTPLTASRAGQSRSASRLIVAPHVHV